MAGVNDCLSTRRFASRPLLHKELLMLSPEDEQMLGMPSTTHRRSSAVSQILRKISVGLKCEFGKAKISSVEESKNIHQKKKR